MGGTTDRYINLFTDYGFKKLFGESPNKDLLKAFLNDLLQEKDKIEEINYLKNEHLGKNEGERRAVYDLYCTNEKGEKFIIEVQRVKQEFFKDRSVYYSSFAIQDQATRSKDWKYKMNAVYTIAIMDFEFDDTAENKFEHRVKLMEVETKQVFYNKLTYLYFEIPKFKKSLSELKTDYDRWLYAFKNLHKLKDMPKELQQGVFKKLFELAEIAKMDTKERMVYEDSLKEYWDLKGSMASYFKEGRAEGRAEGKTEEKLEIAMNMLNENELIEKISKYTGLSIAQIEELKKKID